MRSLIASGKVRVNDAGAILILDSASEIDMVRFAALHLGRDVQRIPFAKQPIIGGTNQGDAIRGTHTCLFDVLGKEVKFTTGVGARFNILSTRTTAAIGFHTLVEAPTGAISLVPQGASLDEPANRIPAIRDRGLFAIPGGLGRRTAALMTPVDATDAGDRDRGAATSGPRPDPATTPPPPQAEPATGEPAAAGAPAPADATKPKRRRRVPAQWLRQMLGNPAQPTVDKAARAAGVSLKRDDAAIARLDQQRRIANQSAVPMRHVGRAADQPRPDVEIVADTIGGKQPASKQHRNQWVQTWVILFRDEHGRASADATYVTFSKRATAMDSVHGFESFCKQAGLAIQRCAISQSVTVTVDQGSEYMKEFKAMLATAGIPLHYSTANSDQKGLVGIAEAENAGVQQAARAVLQMAKHNLRTFSIPPNAYWDYATRHAALQRRVLRSMMRGNSTYDQASRTLGAPWGAVGEETLMLTGPTRKRDPAGKQFAERARTVLFLGRTDDGRYIVLGRDGRISRTMHFRCDKEHAMAAARSEPDATPPPKKVRFAAGSAGGDTTGGGAPTADGTAPTPAVTTGNSPTAAPTTANGPTTICHTPTPGSGTTQRAGPPTDQPAVIGLDPAGSANTPTTAPTTAPPPPATDHRQRATMFGSTTTDHMAGPRDTGTTTAASSSDAVDATSMPRGAAQRATPGTATTTTGRRPRRGRDRPPAGARQPRGRAPTRRGTATLQGAAAVQTPMLPAKLINDIAGDPPRKGKGRRNGRNRSARGATTPTVKDASASTDNAASSSATTADAARMPDGSSQTQKLPKKSQTPEHPGNSDGDNDTETTPGDTDRTATPPPGGDDTTTTAGEDDTASPNTEEPPTFLDSAQKTVKIGDHVTVFWPAMKQHYDGIVIDIQPESEHAPGGTYQVAYADNTEEWHAIAGRGTLHVERTLITACAERRAVESDLHQLAHEVDYNTEGAAYHATTVMRTLHSPTTAPVHPEVAQYIDDTTGDIRRSYVDGVDVMPATPELPTMTRSDEPPTPTTVKEALASSLARYWLPAILKEMGGHLRPTNRPATFQYTTARSRARRQLHVKWVFVIKRFADGTIDKFKARAVLAGHWLKRGIDYVESYSGASPWSDVLDLESLSVNLRLRNYEADLSMAYMFSPLPPSPNGEPVIAVMSPGVRAYSNDGQQLNLHVQQCWYGHPVSGYGLARTLHDRFLNRNLKPGQRRCPIPFEQCPTQPVVFRAAYPEGHPRHGEIFWLHITTDNLRSYTSQDAIQTEFMDFLDSVFETTGGRVALQDQEPQTFHGVQFAYKDGGVHMEMPAFISELLEEVGMRHANPSKTTSASGYRLSRLDTPADDAERRTAVVDTNRMFRQTFTHYDEVIRYYGHIVSSIGWIAQKVGPSMLHAHSVLCRVLAAPSVHAFQGIKHLLRFLSGHQDMYRSYYPHRTYDWRSGDFPEWVIMTDASYADDLFDRRTQGGYAGGFEGQSVTTAHSGKSSRVVTSTYQAESTFAARACKEAMYKRHLFRFLRVLRPGPTKLYVDNYATFLAAGSLIRKWSPASKQFDIEEKFVVECGERGIIEMHHKPGSLPENPKPGDGFRADAMTKTMTAKQMDFYYQELHGVNKRTFLSTDVTVTDDFHISRGGEQQYHFT